MSAGSDQLDADILVIGAGTAGLTAAARLRRLGLRVEVVERAAELRVTGAGIMLHPNALAGLSHLGEQLPASGRWIDRQLTFDTDGREGVLPWAEVWPGQRLPLAIQRQVLAELMLDHLGPSAVTWGVHPIEVAQDAAGVSLTLSDGSVRRCRLLIGADGINSWTRRLIDPEAAPFPLQQTFWRTTVARRAPFDFPEWRVWRGNGQFFGAMPIGRGRVHVFLQSQRPDPGRGDQQAVLADMARMAGEISPRVRELFDALELDSAVDVRAVHGVRVKQWVAGRLVVIGDAAHAVSPATTQGAGLALGDTAALAGEIERHGPTPEALRAFEAARAPVVAGFQRRARLHSELLAAVQDQQVGGEAAARNNSAAWYRRLYQPLMSAF